MPVNTSTTIKLKVFGKLQLHFAVTSKKIPSRSVLRNFGGFWFGCLQIHVLKYDSGFKCALLLHDDM